MKRNFVVIVLVGLLVAGCARVPRESVELSVTIGRDLAAVHEAHRELARVLFARMRSDINRFADEVYAPFQIRNVMDRQGELARSPNPEDQKKSLLLAINAAFKEGAPPELQEAVLDAMGFMVQDIRANVESMRADLLAPLDAQEVEVLGSIGRAYRQLHYANSIVTGHLSSVVKVHEAQADLLEAVGIERDLRKQVSEGLGTAAARIASLVDAAATTEDKFTEVENKAEELKKAVRELETTLEGNGGG